MRKASIRSNFGFGAMLLAILAAIALLLAGAGARAADAERGRLLYENHCTVCHTSVVHLREQRKATTREEIQTWIRRWQKELNLQWGTAEVEDVSDYLNDRYYRLESPS